MTGEAYSKNGINVIPELDASKIQVQLKTQHNNRKKSYADKNPN